MSDGFLGRWSRRKAEARRAEPQHERPLPSEESANPPVAADQPVAGASSPADGVGSEPQQAGEEIAALPSIESLTGDSDVSAFLRKGVPEALRNAALRRMWLLDPKIRDFVGEARDYAWDWNTPGGVPGGGPASAGEHVAAMVDRVLSRGEPSAEVRPEASSPGTGERPLAQTGSQLAPDQRSSDAVTPPAPASAEHCGAAQPPSGPEKKHPRGGASTT